MARHSGQPLLRKRPGRLTVQPGHDGTITNFPIFRPDAMIAIEIHAMGRFT
jgi:hypothetical protein